MPTNWKQLKAIEQKNKAQIKELCPFISERSGIYIFYREENGFKYAYVGQAKHLLTRVAQHLSGYQHIDLSIKKHKLWDVDNLTGWALVVFECDESELDEEEQKAITRAAQQYQLYNHTTGSQGEGKRALGEAKSPKGYRDGVKQGYENARREVKHWFDKHLMFDTKDLKPTQHAIRAFEKFTQFLQGENEND